VELLGDGNEDFSRFDVEGQGEGGGGLSGDFKQAAHFRH
jgi:hypothetical protein